MESGRREAGQQRDDGQHVHPVFGWTELCREEQPCKEEFLPESPATEDSVEQEEMLHIQDGVAEARGGGSDTAGVAAGKPFLPAG